MPSNIKIKSLARSAGKAVDSSGNPTSAVSGSDMANIFLTGDVNQGVYRHVPDTVGSISGTSARPIGDQYQFYEFDGVVPGIVFTSISTISDSADLNVGKQITFTFTTTGVTSTNYNVQLYGYDANQQNESLLATYSGYTTNVTNESKTFTGTLFPNQINFFKLLLTTTSGPTRYGEDITSIYIYPIDLTISSVVLSPAFAFANFNYTTGSVGITVNVNGGVPPYFYNFNGAGYGSADANTATFNNSTTTADDAYDIVVKDSNTPTFDTATTRATTFRAPIRVAVASLNAISEPYVNYTLGSTISNNVAGLTLIYDWVLDSATSSNTAISNPTLYHTSLGVKTHRVNISHDRNTSIRHHNTASTTVQVSPTANVVVTYAAGTESWTAAFDAVINASVGTRTYEYQVRSKDAGGTYTDWGSVVTTSTNSISAQSFAGKTSTAQNVQIRVRVRRTFAGASFNEVSSWVESNEALVPIKGIIVASDQTNILTGGNRTFTGTVTLGGQADNGFTSPTISNNSGSFTGGTISNGTAFTSGIAKNSGTTNVFTITVNNDCSRNDYGKIWHTIGCSDGNGYVLTKQITTQYKISSTSINFRLNWVNLQYWDNAYVTFYADLNSPNFEYSDFAYKKSAGASYTALQGGNFYGNYLLSYVAPAANETWYARIKASGGAYTTSDLVETSATIYGYPAKDYQYTLVHVDSTGAETNAGYPSTSSNMRLRVKRTGGNFNGISVVFNQNFDYLINTLSEADITDTATFFQSNLFNYYDGSSCLAFTYTSRADLTYVIPSSGGSVYYHRLQQQYYLLNQPGGISVTQAGGFVDTGIVIRGVSFNYHVTYTTWGPPFSTPFLGSYYVHIGDVQMDSVYGQRDEFYDDITKFVLTPNVSSQSTFCRYFYTRLSGIVVAARTRGNTYSRTIYGNEYQVTQYNSGFGFTYDLIKIPGSEAVQSVTALIYGRRLASVTAPTITRTKGTSTVNITVNGSGTGADGAVDVSLDGITRTNQYSSDNSTWTNFVGNSVSTGLAFGTTVYVRQVWYHNDWGNTINSSASSVVLEDIDWELELVNLNNVSAPIRNGINGATIFSPGTLFTLSTDSNVAAVTGVGLGSFFSTYFLTVRGLDTDPEMTGAYLAADGASLYRVYRYQNSYWIGNPTTSYSDIKNTVGWPPTAIATGAIVVAFSAPTEYNTEKLITITGQKSSTDTKGQIKYYYRVRTRNEVNEINLAITTYGCSSVTLTATTGQLDTADTMYIQKSTDFGSNWTAVATENFITANTDYTYSVTGLSGITTFRAILYAGVAEKTQYSVSHIKIDPIGNGTVVFKSIDTNCNWLSYRVDRNANANTSTDNYYTIAFYWTDAYGTPFSLAQFNFKLFNFDYDDTFGLNISSLPCDVTLYATVYPISATACAGTAFTGGGTIVKSSSTSACNCTVIDPGCLVYGTLVEMGDGTFKKVEDLELGEVVRSLFIKDLDTSIQENWKDFYTADFEYEEGLSIIQNISDGGLGEYYVINENLKLTYEHPVFIKRAGVCMFTRTDNLTIGDYIFKDDGQFEIVSSIDIIDEFVRTININIEENDVYFANGVLVHNFAEVKPID